MHIILVDNIDWVSHPNRNFNPIGMWISVMLDKIWYITEKICIIICMPTNEDHERYLQLMEVSGYVLRNIKILHCLDKECKQKHL